MEDVALVTPGIEHLPSYADALRRGWSPDNMRQAVAGEQLARIAEDAPAFLASLDDPHARGGPITLPDGSQTARLPGFQRWLWDGAFRASVGLRWRPGGATLPPHVLGHVGFAVVPWKRGRGCAKAALRLVLPEARALGLPYVELTARCENEASQAVIRACGGRLVERFRMPAAYGGRESLLFRIELQDGLHPSYEAAADTASRGTPTPPSP